MILETRAQFARRLGVSRSIITKWVADGRIVLSGDMVDVEASQKRLEETGGDRPDVAARHAAERAEKRALPVSTTPPPPASPAASADSTASDGIGNSYQAARAVKEKYLALTAKQNYEAAAGNLIPREDVDATLMALGATMRARVEAMPDQLTPIVAPSTDFDEVHALNSEAARALLAGMADDLDRARKALERAGSRS